MESSDQINDLATALALAQGAMDHASKDRTNPAFKSKYADLASVVDACRAPLSTNGIAVLQPSRVIVGERGPLVEVETRLVHKSGQWVAETLVAGITDTKAQTIGSAITYLRRYGLSSMVGVAPDDDDGNDASRGRNQQDDRRPEPPKAQPAQQPPPPAAPQQPSAGPTWRERMLKCIDAIEKDAARLGIVDVARKHVEETAGGNVTEDRARELLGTPEAPGPLRTYAADLHARPTPMGRPDPAVLGLVETIRKRRAAFDRERPDLTDAADGLLAECCPPGRALEQLAVADLQVLADSLAGLFTSRKVA